MDKKLSKSSFLTNDNNEVVLADNSKNKDVQVIINSQVNLDNSNKLLTGIYINCKYYYKKRIKNIPKEIKLNQTKAIVN